MIFKRKRGVQMDYPPPAAERVEEPPKVYNGSCKFCKHMINGSSWRFGDCMVSNVITMNHEMGNGIVYTKWERCDLYEPARHCGTCVHSKKREVIAADQKIEKDYCDAENDNKHFRPTIVGVKYKETECPMWELRD